MGMASFNVNIFLAVLFVVLPLAARGFDDGIAPTPATFGNVCDNVNCGRGRCEVDADSPFNFKCDCEPGWKHTRFDDDDDHSNDNNDNRHDDDFEFLPCVIPNCSLNYSCMPAAPPTQYMPKNGSFFDRTKNSTFFDPCAWVFCGDGTCVKNTTYSHGHTCQCNPGADNLLNTSAFPCYSPCALGSNCQDLGINVSRSASTPTSSNNDNQATSFLPGKFHWMGILLISATMALWK